MVILFDRILTHEGVLNCRIIPISVSHILLTLLWLLLIHHYSLVLLLLQMILF